MVLKVCGWKVHSNSLVHAPMAQLKCLMSSHHQQLLNDSRKYQRIFSGTETTWSCWRPYFGSWRNWRHWPSWESHTNPKRVGIHSGLDEDGLLAFGSFTGSTLLSCDTERFQPGKILQTRSYPLHRCRMRLGFVKNTLNWNWKGCFSFVLQWFLARGVEKRVNSML